VPPAAQSSSKVSRHLSSFKLAMNRLLAHRTAQMNLKATAPSTRARHVGPTAPVSCSGRKWSHRTP
jgi:hypothetical protein